MIFNANSILHLIDTNFTIDLNCNKREILEPLTIIISPYAPHITEELWKKLGKQESIFKASWPHYDAAAIIEEEILIVIQVNGKLRSRVTVPVGSSEEEIKKIALSDEKAHKWIESKEIKKVIVVPKKLVNVVVK